MSRISINLYRHEVTWPSDAWLVSISGKRRDAVNIAKSIVTAPTALAPCKPHGEVVYRGRFGVPEWKLRELGGMQTANENQGSLAL